MVICFVEFLGTIGEFLLTNTKSNMRPRQRVLRQWFFYLYIYYRCFFRDARNFYLSQDKLAKFHMLVVEPIFFAKLG